MIAPLSILIYFAWKNNALERAEIIPPLQEKKKKKNVHAIFMRYLVHRSHTLPRHKVW